MAREDHVLEDAAVLSGILGSEVLGVAAGPDVAETLLVLSPFAEELLDL